VHCFPPLLQVSSACKFIEALYGHPSLATSLQIEKPFRLQKHGILIRLQFLETETGHFAWNDERRHRAIMFQSP